MPYVRVKHKFQVTIPTAVREAIGLHEGDTLETRVEDGNIVLIPQQVVARKHEPAKKPEPEASREKPLTKYLGAAKGLYASPQEVDETVRRLRDEWQD